jgi:hypothetical protein
MATRGRRAPPPDQHGSTSSIRGNQVYEGNTKSRSAWERSPEVLRQGITEESTGKSDREPLKKGNRGTNRAGSCSIFGNPFFDADPLRDRNPARGWTMSSTGNGVIKGEPLRHLPTRSCLREARRVLR